MNTQISLPILNGVCVTEVIKLSGNSIIIGLRGAPEDLDREINAMGNFGALPAIAGGRFYHDEIPGLDINYRPGKSEYAEIHGDPKKIQNAIFGRLRAALSSSNPLDEKELAQLEEFEIHLQNSQNFGTCAPDFPDFEDSTEIPGDMAEAALIAYGLMEDDENEGSF